MTLKQLTYINSLASQVNTEDCTLYNEIIVNEELNHASNDMVNAIINELKAAPRKSATKEYLGKTVNHKAFGNGEIVDEYNDIVTVKFENTEVKQLSLNFLLANGYVK